MRKIVGSLIIVALIFLTGCQTQEPSEADRTRFIHENNLESAIELSEQGAYYYFLESTDKVHIYVLKGMESAKFVSSHTELPKTDEPLYLGGLYPGYVGIYLTSKEIIDSTKKVRFIINNETFDYDFSNQNALVIKNKQITNYNFIIEFIDNKGTVLYKYYNGPISSTHD
ncbi:hypothetical protein ACFOQM_00175 [Paenibacillus sp. GCM10012307]|uniref:Lipoprotein n=1 Tax=Paenibacillus roseus TaxID=2798579 RepID=A0A934IZ66_9BACL|nr:hypothetical protein [Paenibacillus roseus]MBJ6359745.1 hypothetical protein [Paenibacillus roseus]